MKSNKINASPIARTICLALALVNQFLTMLGHSMINIDDATITNAVSEVWLIVAAVWAWWKNNPFTEEAIKADSYLQELRYNKAKLTAQAEEEGKVDDN